MRYFGIGLFVGLVLLLLAPLWMFPIGGHPLANKTVRSLCAYVDSGPLRRLERLAVELEDRRERTPRDASWPTCSAKLETRYPEPAGKGPTLDATLVTERALRSADPRASTERFVDTWVNEARASGARIEAVPGPWLQASLLEYPAGERELRIIAEDDGIALLIRGSGIPSDQLALFAADLAERLRQPR